MKVSIGLLCASVLVLGACASAQRPVLYPNTHLNTVGDSIAQRDIDDCMRTADNAGVSRTNNQVARSGAQGAAVGAAAGGVGTVIRGGSVGEGAAAGAAVGAAAGAVRGAFHDNVNPTYRNFVQRCLQDRGYDVIGWQ